MGGVAEKGMCEVSREGDMGYGGLPPQGKQRGGDIGYGGLPVATTGKPHRLIKNCRNPRNCLISNSHILPTSSTTFEEVQLENNVSI